MNKTLIPELGEDFAAISSGVCGISPFMAKLILYTTLDDGYGRYFHDIFSEEDRAEPYLVQDIGSPLTRRLDSVSKKCTEQARECIAAHGLEIGEWRKSWRKVALCASVSKKLQQYKDGELGTEFLGFCRENLSFVDSMIAKRALMDFIACRGAAEKVFTDADRASFLYGSLIGAEVWHPTDICSAAFFEKVSEKAAAFAADKLGMFDEGAPFVGVTFGWPAPDRKEWHLYGDLLSTEVFRCELKDLPSLFGMACFDTPAQMLARLYEGTHLCVVAVDAVNRVIPDKVGEAFVYEFPVTDLVSCKWVGTLPEVLGPYKKTQKAVREGYTKIKKESAYNA